MGEKCRFFPLDHVRSSQNTGPLASTGQASGRRGQARNDHFGYNDRQAIRESEYGNVTMPMHDWTRVEARIFHHFHRDWITEIARTLNRGILPADYYALAEQHAARFGLDVLTLQKGQDSDGDGMEGDDSLSGGGVLLVAPKLQLTAETDRAFYRRKQSSIAVRHVSGDRIVAMIEIVSPINKASRNGLRAFVEKAAELLDKSIHLLILDPHPPGRRDPNGIHGEIWDYFAGEEYAAPADKSLTLVAYESGLSVRAYVVPLRVGDALPDMPVFLEPEKAVMVPLEATYQAAFAAVPRRWQRVLETPA